MIRGDLRLLLTHVRICLPSANSVIFQRHLVVFPQRMPDPIFRAEDAPQIRMAGEVHAGQVVDLALVPIGRAPDAGHRRHLRQLARLVVLPARQNHLQHEAVLVLHAEQVINDFRVRLPLRLGRLLFVGVQIVDARDAIQIVERERRLVAQIAANLEQAVRRDFDPRIEVLQVRAGDLVAELGFELIDEMLGLAWDEVADV